MLAPILFTDDDVTRLVGAAGLAPASARASELPNDLTSAAGAFLEDHYIQTRPPRHAITKKIARVGKAAERLRGCLDEDLGEIFFHVAA